MNLKGFGLLAVGFLLLTACGGKKHDMALYEARIDSLRKAEQLMQLKKTAGVYNDPVEAFFDTLQIRPLPIRSAGGNIGRLAHFTDVPKSLAYLWGYPVETPLKMIKLPKHNNFFVVMLAEQHDSLPPLLTLVTIGRNYELVDQLIVYEQKAEEHGDDFGLGYNDYYITSNYEVTLMFAFIRQDSDYPRLESTRRYIISGDGHFEEVVFDL